MVQEIYGETVNVIMSNDMPLTMPEHIIKNADDSFTIFLNAKLSQEAQKEGFEHALKHIKNDDFSKEDVQQIEAEAHDFSKHVNPVPDWLITLYAQMAYIAFLEDEIEEYRSMIYDKREENRRRYRDQIQKWRAW